MEFKVGYYLKKNWPNFNQLDTTYFWDGKELKYYSAKSKELELSSFSNSINNIEFILETSEYIEGEYNV